MRYELNKEGWVVACGDVASYTYELTDEPFGMDGVGRWRMVNGQWTFKEIIMIPQSISKLQCVAYLLEIGRYAELMAIIDADATGVSRILFDAAAVLDIDSNMVNQFAAALKMSSEDKDEFFVNASKILV